MPPVSSLGKRLLHARIKQLLMSPVLRVSSGVKGRRMPALSKRLFSRCWDAADLSPQLKDAAGQLLQNITGQQLLLSPERNGAFFSQVTFHIPLPTSNGSGTAEVHVQSRRSDKGTLDASNCRLLFDLRLAEVGDTVVDVTVADKVVSLHVFNSHPAMQSLAETGRPALQELLESAGYRLLGMKVSSPEERLQKQAEAVSAKQLQPQSGAYKGVDYRI